MAKKKTTEKSETPLGFEASLVQLEQIVHDLEDGQTGLEESLARYEQGVKLLRRCYDLLGKAERRIELLSAVDAQGNPTTQPMAEEASESLEQKAAQRSRRRSATNKPDKPTKPNPMGGDSGPSGGPDDVDESGRLF